MKKIKRFLETYPSLLVLFGLCIVWIGIFICIVTPYKKEYEFKYSIMKTYLEEDKPDEALVILEDIHNYYDCQEILEDIKPKLVSEKIYELEDKSKENIESILREYYHKED